MSVSPIFQATARNADIQRSKGHSAVAAAAYISGLDVVETRNGEKVAYHRFSRKEEVLFSDLILTKDAPDYVPRDPIAYWQAREDFEDLYIRKRYRKSSEYAEERIGKAQVALKQVIPLPSEWSAAMIRDFGQRYGEAIGEEFGLPVHVAGHDDRLISRPGGANGKGKKGNGGSERGNAIKAARKKEELFLGLNNHLHVQIDHRQLTRDGWGSKPDFIAVSSFARNSWTEDNKRFIAQLINEISSENGLDIVAEARSLQQRGSPFSATVHEGQAATAMRRSGKKVSVAAFNDEVKLQNREEVLRDPDAVIRHISITRATFSEADLKRELFNRVLGDDADYALVEHRLMGSDLLVKVGEDVEGRTRYATREYIDREKTMFAAAGDLARSTGHEARQDVLENGLKERFAFLSAEQIDAVRLLGSTSAFGMIKGAAGVGKSTLLKAAIPAAEAAGQKIRAFAPTGQAAKILTREIGTQANTWASYTYRREKAEAARVFLDKAEKEKRELDARTKAALKRDIKKFEDIRIRPGDFVLVDEAGMLSVKDTSLLLDEVRRAGGAKIRLIGDDSQFSSVEAGAAFRGLVEEFGGAHVLTIRRQKQDWAKKASMGFERGDVRSGLSAYRDRNLVKFESDRASTYFAMVDAYMKDIEEHPGDSRQMLAYTKNDVAALNKIARQRHVAAGLVEAEGIDIAGQLVGRGDKVVFQANDLTGFKVKGLDGYSEGVANGSMGIVEKIDGSGQDTVFTVRLNDDSGIINRVSFRLEDYDAIQPAYAVTSHKSQGSTYSRVFALASRFQRTDAIYVAMTRAEQDTTLFVDASELKDFDDLVRSTSRRPASDLVRDYQPKPPAGTSEADPAWEIARRLSAARQDVVSIYSTIVNWKEFHEGDVALKEHPDYQLYREALEQREKEAKQALEYMRRYQDLRAIPDSTLTSAERQERDLAGHVARVLEQSGMRRDLVSTWANDADRPRTDAELRAIEKLQLYAGVNQDARDLYNTIKAEVGTKQLVKHERWPERQSLVLERDALASEIRADSSTYRRHLHEVKGVSWNALGKQAAEHEKRAKISDPSGKAIESYKAAGRRVNELKRRPSNNLAYRKAIAEYDRLASDLYESVEVDTLKSFGVYESQLRDQTKRHAVREEYSRVIEARNIGHPDASGMKLDFGRGVQDEAIQLQLPSANKLTARPYYDVLAEHGIESTAYLADLGLKVERPTGYRPVIRSSLASEKVLSEKPALVPEVKRTIEPIAQQSAPPVKPKEEVPKGDDRPVHTKLDLALKAGDAWMALRSWAEVLPKATELSLTAIRRGIGFTQRKSRQFLANQLYQAYGEAGRGRVDFAIRTWQDGREQALPLIYDELNKHPLRGKKGIMWDDAERKAANAAVVSLPEAIKEAADEAEQSDREDNRRREADLRIRHLTKELGPTYSDPEEVRRVGDTVDKAVRAEILRDPLGSYYQLKAIEVDTKPVRVLGAREEETWNPSLRIVGLRRESARAVLKSPIYNRLPEPEQGQILKDSRVPSTGGGHGPTAGTGVRLK